MVKCMSCFDYVCHQGITTIVGDIKVVTHKGECRERLGWLIYPDPDKVYWFIFDKDFGFQRTIFESFHEQCKETNNCFATPEIFTDDIIQEMNKQTSPETALKYIKSHAYVLSNEIAKFEGLVDETEAMHKVYYEFGEIYAMPWLPTHDFIDDYEKLVMEEMKEGAEILLKTHEMRKRKRQRDDK